MKVVSLMLGVLGISLHAADIKSYSPIPSISLRYVISRPLGTTVLQKRPVWIYQDGDGAVVTKFPVFQAVSKSEYLSRSYNVVAVWPELRREYFSGNPKEYCNLDFLHRVHDLNALIEVVKSLDFVDSTRIFLIGHSAGSEIVTKVSNQRSDIAGVVTIGGGVLQLMSYLEEIGGLAWTKEAMIRNCDSGDLKQRSGVFWTQLLHSNLMEDIKNSKKPYLALVGSNDDICRPAVQEKFVPHIVKVKKNFTFEVVDGMGHGPGLSTKPWSRISEWMGRIRAPAPFSAEK